MKINLLKHILTLLFVIGIVSSCKDYLELEPISSVDPGYVFSNVTNATNAIYGVYAAMGGDQGYGIRISMYYPYDNDEMMGQGGAQRDNERRDIARYAVEPSNTQLAAPFNQLYAGIEKANICIYYIPKMAMYESGTSQEKRELRRLHGEALTLRAQFYFELIRNWGDVPAQFQPASFETDLYKAKEDRDVIYDQIIADLEEAAALVPWRSEVPPEERITQGAVRALRARIALFRGGYSLRADNQMKRPDNYLDFYQIARDECNAVIQKGEHRLNPSFEAVFKDALNAHTIEPNGEVIWEVGMTGGQSSLGDSKLGYYNGPQVDGKGNAALSILPTFFYSFNPNDTRRDVTCAPYSVNANNTITARALQQMPDGKFRRHWIKNPQIPRESNDQHFGVNWPLIRYSDVLLMFAEAENELSQGPTAAAVAAYEEVRIRGFGGNASLIGTTPSDYEGFFDALMKERSFELAGEGIRKYDLIRWNLLETRINETKAALLALVARQPPYDQLPSTMYYIQDTTSLIWLNSFYEPEPASAPEGSASISWVSENVTTTIADIYANGFMPNKSELLPIHTSVIDANPNITQDYGY